MKVTVQHPSGIFWCNWVYHLRKNKVDTTIMDMRTSNGYEEALRSDGVMWHIDMQPSMQSSAISVLSAIEQRKNILVFPNYATRWHFDNKVSQYYMLKSAGINMPRTHVFWNEEEAQSWLIKNNKYPLIAKFKRGAGSSCVFLLSSKKDASRYLRKMFSSRGISHSTGGIKKTAYRRVRNVIINNIIRLPYPFPKVLLGNRTKLMDVWPRERGYVYFQEYLPGNDFDTRVTVIGNRAFAFRRYNRKNDFRASGSGEIDYDSAKIDEGIIKLAHSISIINNYQSMAYDFLMDENGKPSLVEMSYGYQSKAIFNCPGFWNEKMKWYDGHILPEAAHVEDFIAEIENR